MRLIFLDCEVYPNYFLVVFYDPYNKEYLTFKLWTVNGVTQINELDKLKNYLIKEKDTYFVGYNSFYDMNILTYITKRPSINNEGIKAFNDEYIGAEWPIYRESEFCNKTIDLMSINNFGPRSAKTTSLKKLEFSLRKKSIKDLPYHFNDLILTEKQDEEIVKYCKYDVETTVDVYKFTKELLKLRIDFGDFNKIDLLNSTEPDIAKKYMVKQLSYDLNISETDVKKLKTYNEKIAISEVILPYINKYKFVNPVLKSALDFYKNITLDASIKSNIDSNKKLINLKNQISKIIPYYDGEIVYAAGGLHFSTKPGIYQSSEEYIILDWDKVSYYPHFAMKHGRVPAHLGESYGKFLLNTFNERKKYSKKTHPIINHCLKIILNSSYGS